jgi:hypothetical protein
MENRKLRCVGSLVFINCTIRGIRKGRTEIISASEQKGQRVRRFGRLERSDVMRRYLNGLSEREVTMYRWTVLF